MALSICVTRQGFLLRQGLSGSSFVAILSSFPQDESGRVNCGEENFRFMMRWIISRSSAFLLMGDDGDEGILMVIVSIRDACSYYFLVFIGNDIIFVTDSGCLVKS
mmetsp:Transcript_5547/g.11121  ORF Transcript_5547/g.11121 Transcript_5547/m.11121 type:complete len:106 (+) Transcript_5547:227-544(+)